MSTRPWTLSVIRVGGGRGFVVGAEDERFVITAAHFLPHFPPSVSFSTIEERTYAKLLGQLGRKRTPVWAECCFVDPIADLAVLWSPDRQHLDKEADAYDALLGAAAPLPIGDLPLTRSPVTLAGNPRVGDDACDDPSGRRAPSATRGCYRLTASGSAAT